ncbi:MAG: DUF362 domain-containing protein [Clostridiales bacterium]|nr:DUF362 domain-containing protein [Clostridiales bacterium]MCF8021815.1 DUF362 domain-containing protein [Clostridiales bacterium]
MSKPVVYFANARCHAYDYDYGLLGKFEEMLNRVNLEKYISAKEYVPVKMHLGSRGAYRTVRPVFVRKIVEAVNKINGQPFITESVRLPGLKYLQVANANGLNEQSLGAPIVIADGIFGLDSVKVESGPILNEIGVCSAIYDAPAMIVVSHCKGHIASGYGGAIKNLGMGGIAFKDRSSGISQRGRMHFLENEELTWNEEKCNMCYQCVNVCPHESLAFDENNQLQIDQEKCIRCGRCARVCPEGALVLPQNEDLFQKVLAEATCAVLKTFDKKRVLYINFITEVIPECDCMPMTDTPLVPDIGIMISDDIVAIEKATLDMINKSQLIQDSKVGDNGITTNENIFKQVTGKDPYKHVKAAAEYGLGSLDYEIEMIDCKPKPDGSTAPKSVLDK